MAETPPARKFMFDKSFDAMSGGGRAPERKPVTLKPEQVDALKKDSYDQGFVAGQKTTGDEQTQHLVSLLDRVEKQIAQINECFATLRQEQDDQLRAMVLAIARKLLPDFTDKHGLQEIQALLDGIVSEMIHEPRLVVRVHDTQFDVVNTKIQQITVQKAYAGKVVVLADAEIASGDCRVEWADGGIERNTQTTWKNIEQAVGAAADHSAAKPDHQKTDQE